MSANRFKRWMSARPSPPPIGTWLMSGAPATAEALSHCGFDFLVLDLEHVAIEVADAPGLLRAIECGAAEPLVRLAWNDMVHVKRVLDAGARSIMVPFVETEEDARRAVAQTRYPPEGVRGVAAVHRGSRYGRTPDYLRTAGEEIAVVCQLESPGAVARAEAIARTPGVDALFLGPGDLSAGMGRIGEVGHPEVQAEIRAAVERAHAGGKPIGIVGPNPEMVRRFLDYGYDWAAVASDMAMMTGRALEWRAAIGGGPQPDAPAAPY